MERSWLDAIKKVLRETEAPLTLHRDIGASPFARLLRNGRSDSCLNCKRANHLVHQA
jgi:hypothetical protein